MLAKQFDIYKERKKEDQGRQEYVPKTLEILKQMKDNLPDILVKKTWITEEEGKDVFAKIDEMSSWVENKMIEQDLLKLSDEPAFTLEEMVKKVKKVDDLYKKVTGKKQPKEKKPKKEQKEEDANEETSEEAEEKATEDL